MGDYKREARIAQIRKLLADKGISVCIPDEDVEKFDELVKEFDLVIADVTDWKEQFFNNPQDYFKD